MAEYRQWRNENRTYLKDVIPLDTPYNLKVEVSSLCNARCVYCAHASKAHGVYEGNMTWNLFEKILEDSRQFPRKFKVMEMFSFGESMCNPHLAQMIKRAKEADVADKINLTTNGLLLTPQKADELIASGIDIIRISLQGLDAEAYRKTCKTEVNFEKFLDILRYLHDNSGGVSIRMKISDLAIADVPDGRERFEQIFAPLADTIFVEKIIPMYADIDYNTIDKNIYRNAINGREDITQTEVHTVCNRPFYRLRVAADGKVTAACCDIPNDFYYGDIYEDSLVNIWNGERRKNLLKMQLEGKRFQHPICKTCTIPNDITTEADIIDPYAKELLNRI
ncbi:MAG: radical SAM protein [Lachnospiraceae bacterium]|nr:radical SAM protein [Lachnospiraceae bacterium]